MKMRDFEEFQGRVSNGEQVPFDETERKYLPLQSDYDAVRAWLVGQGFTVTMDDARRLSIFVRGTAAQIQASFGVTMQSVTVDGTTYAAASTAPSLPASVAGGVLGINGLQPYLKARRHENKTPYNSHARTNNTYPYLVPEIRKAYDAATLVAGRTTLTGVSQKIAILIDTFPNTADLSAFWSDNGIGQSLSNIEQINVPGGTLDATEGEETLDVEWASSIAPNCKVRVYESDTLSFNNIGKCLAQIATDVSGTSPTQPQIHELSMSIGIGETYLGAGNSIFTSEAQYFTTIANGSAAYGGVSVFVSAGDAGSTPDGTGHASGGPLQAEYESTDPSVTGVGGTALVLDTSTGLRSSEAVWNDPAPATTTYYSAGATGGGTSIQFARPTWQVGTGVPTGTKRLAPDVALVAAGSTPGLLVFTPAGGSQGTYYVSGTSWSAPTWAGFAALINQGRATVNRLPVGLLNPHIYPLIGTNNFTDITTGNNAAGASANGSYAATVGYDECTGVGVPDMANLLATLLGPTITGFSPTAGGAGTSVIITGTNFYASAYYPPSVKFNGVAATAVTVNSPTQITATVPSGATSGPVTVTSLNDATISSGGFSVGPSDLTVTCSHADPFTYHDTGDTYTITVTNGGVAQTSGTVSVVDTLPSGTFTATSLTSTGWTIAANYLSATRADALAAGGSYPPLTLTVSVIGAPQTTTNQVNVSGGGEVNTSNDIAQDSTTITGQTPSQAYRYQYFGTNANTGNAADTANPSGDGLVNLVKYALGLDPTMPEINPVTADTSTGYLRLTVPKNPNATDITYNVQFTSDLTDPMSWVTSTFYVQNSSTTLQVRDTMPVSGTAKRFVRLQISR